MTYLSMLLSLICFIILALLIALQQGQDTAGHAAAGAGESGAGLPRTGKERDGQQRQNSISAAADDHGATKAGIGDQCRREMPVLLLPVHGHDLCTVAREMTTAERKPPYIIEATSFSSLTMSAENLRMPSAVFSTAMASSL